jgi:type I restriction enzyme S subunit
MSELTDWGQTTLGKHCVICTGKKDVNEGEMSGIYPFFTCSRNHIYSNKYSFDTEALLIAGNGEVGNVEYYKGKFEAYQRTYVLDNFNINIQYIYHLLKYSLKDTLSRSHAGSVIQFIKLEDLTGFTFFYPKDNQEILRIVKILDTIDTAIQQTQAIINKLKQLKQGLLHDLLTRGVGANGELRPCYEDAPHLYKESPLGWIPKEWEVVTLEEVADVARGKFTHRPRNDPAFYGGSFPFIQTGDVTAVKGGFVSQYSQTLSVRGILVSQEFPAQTIAITIAANIADTAILAFPMYFPDSVVGAIVKTTANVRYIELCIRRSKRSLDAKAPQSAQKNINLQDLRPLRVPLPLKSEQDEIANRYDVLEKRISDEEAILFKLMKEKSGLMDDLLTGRVRVSSLLQPEASSA